MPEHVVEETVILIAEARERIRTLVAAMLMRHGYQVLSTPNGEQALERSESRKGPIHMLLTNIVMPGMNGFELADRIRIKRPEIKAIVMSSHMDAQILRENPEPINGVAVIIEDEFLPLSLLAKIKQVLDNDPTATSAV